MPKPLRIKLQAELESWNGFLTDRCYLIKFGDDLDSFLPEWIDVLVLSVTSFNDEATYVSSAPYIRILLDYWRNTMRAEVEHVVTKGWTKDLVPDHVLARSAAISRDELDESWVMNLMVDHRWCEDLYHLMDNYAATDPQIVDK